MNKDKQISVLYFGSYSLNNSRNAILMRGLKENGVRILECNDHSRSYILKYIKLFFKYLKYIGKFDVMVVGFAGQEMMPLARVLTRKPILFDVFTSHYMGYILDRKYFSPQSLRAKYYHFIDKFSCWLADIVILDTQAHIDYFVNEFDLNPDKFRKIWLGANSGLFHTTDGFMASNQSLFNVVFWGNFIPLQGVEYIIKAAKILENENIKFYLIGGGGQTMKANKELADKLGLKNIEFTGRLSQEDLNRKVTEADVCLGAFSDNIKTDITIQNKIFEALSSGRTVVTARTTAIRELLEDKKNCLLCNKADPDDLARKILELKDNPNLNNKIAKNGHDFFVENLSENKLGGMLIKVITDVIEKRH